MQTRLLIPVLILIGGCAHSPSPRYDAKFGQAVRDARQLMTLNPDAGRGPGPSAGMDGKAAAEAIGRYHESFKSPPPVVNVINIGGGVGGGGAGR